MQGGGRGREGRGRDVQARGGNIIEVQYRDPDCGFGDLS
jgi:hypothetical protein